MNATTYSFDTKVSVHDHLEHELVSVTWQQKDNTPPTVYQRMNTARDGTLTLQGEICNQCGDLATRPWLHGW